MSERKWATDALAALARGESVQVRPRGHSMRGRIDDGALVTLEPCRASELVVGDIVLARVRGWLLVLHQVLGIESGRFQIGTVAGRSDGWVTADDIFGRVAEVQAVVEQRQVLPTAAPFEGGAGVKFGHETGD